jgi:hypothetical protein
VAETQCVQEMLKVKKVAELMNLKVDLPMKRKVDNKGAKNLINSWRVGCRVRFVDLNHYF